jgi:hypothetical protein
MPWSISDADSANAANYDNTHPWDSLFNSDRSMPTSPYTRQLMDQAEVLADPSTPRQYIRDTMTNAPMFDWGPARPQPTIDTIISGQALQAPQANWSDYSGTPAGQEAGVRNHISIGS